MSKCIRNHVIFQTYNTIANLPFVITHGRPFTSIAQLCVYEGLQLYRIDYEANTWWYYTQTSVHHFQWVFKILRINCNLPYLLPYINSLYQNLMYIEGCNSFKWKDMKLLLCVSNHRHWYSTFNEFLEF